MNILFCSVPFRPSVGGIETVSSILAEQFQRRGHQVTLVTQTPAGAAGSEVEPYRVVRRPGAGQLWALVRRADVVFHNNISLRLAWPLLSCHRPWVVAHHTWIPTAGAGRVKRWLLRFAKNISVSRAVAASLPVPSAVVPNPYRPALFRSMGSIERTRDVVFLGRLVSDKGVDVLLLALQRLQDRGVALSATIVGDGPERERLLRRATELGVAGRVEFVGRCQGDALVRLLHAHRFLVVPSTWEEPFGVVALEAIACGCVPVVACSGGLPDAVGACGQVFPKGDSAALADRLSALQGDADLVRSLQRHAAAHLAMHRPEPVADRYLQVLNDAFHRRRAAPAA